MGRGSGKSFRKPLVLVLAAVLAATVVATSASAHSTAPTKKKAKYSIAFVVANVNDAFYQKAHEGAVAEAKKLGVDLIYAGPNQFSAQAQIPVVDALLAKHPDALAIAPADPTAFVAPLQKWADAKIPIITYDGSLTKPPYKLLSQIGSANFAGGQLAADQMAKAIGGKGKVATIDLNTANKVLVDRLNGFLARLKSKYPNIEVVDKQLTGLDFPRAQTITQTYLNKYSDLAGIFTTYSFATEYAATAIQGLNVKDRVSLIGFEAGRKEIQGIKAGTIKATIAQQPALEAKYAIDYAYWFLTGKKGKIKAVVNLPDVVINAQNVDKMKAYYYYTAK
jgi:ribose transport system substrate-binding protein